MSLLLNIVLEHVEKRFKGKTIFEDLNFQVDKGQTIGFWVLMVWGNLFFLN